MTQLHSPNAPAIRSPATRRIGVAASVGAALLLGQASTALAGAAPGFAPHRAVYEISLDKAAERTGVSGMDGRLVYEFDGSPCDGYTMNMRFVLRMQLPDDVRVTDQQTTTFESGDGNEFTFVTKSFTDDKLDKELRGSATRDSEGIEVAIEKPDEVDVTLQPSMFPTAHLEDLISKARDGKAFYETTIFDGTDDGDRLLNTSVVIGKKADAAADDPEREAVGALAKEAYWPVTIAYFDPLEETGGEALPQYRIGFKLHENGVTRSLTMDYGDFVLTGRLSKLDMLEPAAACDR